MGLLTVLLGMILLMNEAGIFKVEKVRMRYCVAAAVVFTELPLLITATEKRLRDPKNKYVLLGCAIMTVFIVCTMICFHTLPALILPMLLAAQYPSKRMGVVALIGSVICAVLSPICSLLSGCWDSNFLTYLVEIGYGSRFVPQLTSPMADWETIRGILLFLSLPNAMILVGLYPLIRSVAGHGEERLKDEL